MPRIAPNATRGLLTKRLTQALPELGQIVGSPTAAAIEKQRYAWLDAQNWQVGAQASLAGVGVNLGFSAPQVFSAVSDAIARDVQASSEHALLQSTGSGLLDDALADLSDNPQSQIFPHAIEAGVGAAVNIVAAAAPVVGWVLKIAWGVAKFFMKIKASNVAPEEAHVIYPASMFSPERDLDAANFVLDVFRDDSQNDWTRLYSPPGAPEFRYEELPNHNFRFESTPLSQGTQVGSMGFVPGSGFLHQAMETEMTEPNVYMPFETGATLMPSARQQLMWWWKHIINTNGASAFAIDTTVCKTMWVEYLWALHNFLYNTKLSLPNNAPSTLAHLTDTIIKLWDRTQDGKPIFGWGGVTNGVVQKPQHAEKANYAPVKELEVLRHRQLSFCDTVTVAYVDENFAALATKNTELWRKWDMRRRQLLEDKWVCRLDLSMIPDKDYRDAVIQKRKGYNCLVADVPVTWKAPGAPHRLPPRGQQGAAGVDDSGGGGGVMPRKAARWGGIAAAAAGLYMVLRGK